jgi:hypothetical protein
MSGQRVLPQQHSQTFVTGVGPHLDRPSPAGIRDLVDHGGLLGIRPVERPGQRRIGQGGTVPDDGTQQIGGGRAGETGEDPLGLAVQVGEAPIGVEGEDAFADAIQQIERLSRVEQPGEPLH